jgi:RNA polymerase sigma-70 factor (ECF subfamily)
MYWMKAGDIGEAAGGDIATDGELTRQEEAVAALKANDSAAWRTLFEESYDRVYRYAYLRTGSVHDAEDIASTVFADAVKNIRNFQYRGTPIEAWLFRIAHNVTVDVLKRRTRSAGPSLDAPETERHAVAKDDTAASDDWRDVSKAMAGLRPEHQEVLTLRIIQDQSVEQVARTLGKSEGAVKMMQMRALQALRKKLVK